MGKPYEIELLDEAENDFDEAYNYYAIRSEVVADDFYQHIKNSIERISENPFAFPQIHRSTRKCVVSKFPFVIYFKVDESIQVISVFHTNRNPKVWKERS